MVIWTNHALFCIKEFVDGARLGTKENVRKYILNLVDYVEILQSMNKLGKVINITDLKYEIRQIIYKKHRIIYMLNKNNFYVLSVIHVRVNLKNALEILIKNIEED